MKADGQHTNGTDGKIRVFSQVYPWHNAPHGCAYCCSWRVVPFDREPVFFGSPNAFDDKLGWSPRANLEVASRRRA